MHDRLSSHLVSALASAIGGTAEPDEKLRGPSGQVLPGRIMAGPSLGCLSFSFLSCFCLLKAAKLLFAKSLTTTATN